MTDTNDTQRPQPKPMPRPVLCPYCGASSHDSGKCTSCGGVFEPLSRQATQNAMGPWFIRDESNPFRPGCSFETLKGLITRGKIGPDTVIRGPSTRQFWELARRSPGIANLLGLCHNCQEEVKPGEFSCGGCGAAFGPEQDRQHLGLGPVRLLPGQASPERIAAASMPTTHAPAHSSNGGLEPRPTKSQPTPRASDEAPSPRVETDREQADRDDAPTSIEAPADRMPSSGPRLPLVLLAVFGTVAAGLAAVAIWRMAADDRLVSAGAETEPAQAAVVPAEGQKDDANARIAADTEYSKQIVQNTPPEPAAALHADETPQTLDFQGVTTAGSEPNPRWSELDRLRDLR